MAEGAGDKMPLEERTPAEGQDKLDSRLNRLVIERKHDQTLCVCMCVCVCVFLSCSSQGI